MTLKESLIQSYNIEHLGMRPLEHDTYAVIVMLCNYAEPRERPVDELRRWSRLIALAAARIEPPPCGS